MISADEHGRRILAAVVPRRAAVVKIHHRPSHRRHTRLQRRRRQHGLRLREVADRAVGKHSLQRKPRHRAFKAHAACPARPARVGESARRPRRAERVAGRHEVFQRRRRREVSRRRHGLHGAIRLVRVLRRVGIKFRRHRRIRPHQREVAAARAQLEIRVQIRRWVHAIFAGGKDHDEPLRRDAHCGESPLSHIARVVREPPSAEVHRRRPVILDLDPVRRAPILIRQPVIIIGKELRDKGIRKRRRRKR